MQAVELDRRVGASARAHDIRALVVGAEHMWRRRMLRALQPRFHEVHDANSLDAAFGQLAERRFDAVVLDGHLAQLDRRSLSWLRAGQQSLAILAVTSRHCKDYHAVFRAGVDDCLPAPFKARELCARIEHSVGIRRERAALEAAVQKFPTAGVCGLRQQADQEPSTDRAVLVASSAASSLATVLEPLGATTRCGDWASLLARVASGHTFQTVLIEEDLCSPDAVAELRFAGFTGDVIYVTNTRAYDVYAVAHRAGANNVFARADIDVMMSLLRSSLGARGPRASVGKPNSSVPALDSPASPAAVAERRVHESTSPRGPLAELPRLSVVERHIVLRGTVIRLTLLQARFMRLLLQRRGRLVRRSTTCAALWPNTGESAEKRLDTLVRRLRSTLGPENDVIETVHTAGHRVRVERGL